MARTEEEIKRQVREKLRANHAVSNAKAKEPRLRASKVRLERKIADAPNDPRVSQFQVDAWKARVAEYDLSIAAIESGSYRGATGNPIGVQIGVVLPDLD